MKKRLLVTGYCGFVAGNVVEQARPGWEVHALARSEAPEAGDGVSVHRLDLRDTDLLRRVFREARPDAVIHAAALADIDTCESHRDEADQVNVGVTRELVRLCREVGARLVFCSSDTVFDGTKGLYSETDVPRALNFYAETKVRAERAVLAEARSGVVARLSLVLGLPVSGHGNSFLAKMIAALEEGKTVRFPANEVRTPVDVITASRALLELAASSFAGIVHVAGTTRVNRYEMALEIAERLGFARSLVIATDSSAMAGRAPRPADVSLDSTRARSLLATPMLSLREGLKLAMKKGGE